MKEKIKKIINQVFEERGIKVERIILYCQMNQIVKFLTY